MKELLKTIDVNSKITHEQQIVMYYFVNLTREQEQVIRYKDFILYESVVEKFNKCIVHNQTRDELALYLEEVDRD